MRTPLSKLKRQTSFRLDPGVLNSLRKMADEASSALRAEYGDVSMAAVLESAVRFVALAISSGTVTYEELLTETPADEEGPSI